MGRTPKPLSILAHKSLVDDATLEKLAAQGHTVTFEAADLEEFDIVLGPNCWRVVNGMESYVQIAIDSARKAKYPSRGRAGE